MSPITMSSSSRTHLFAPGVIAVLVTVTLITLSPIAVGWWPLVPSDPQWRHQAAGIALRTAPQVAVLLVLTGFISTQDNSYLALRRVALAARILAIVILAGVAMFAADFMTIRRSQPHDTMMKFTLEGLRLVGTSAVLAVVLLWAARRGLAAADTDRGPRRVAGEGLIVGVELPPLEDGETRGERRSTRRDPA